MDKIEISERKGEYNETCTNVGANRCPRQSSTRHQCYVGTARHCGQVSEADDNELYVNAVGVIVECYVGG